MKLPKIPTPKLSETAKLRVTRVYALSSAVMYKVVPVVVFALIFAQIAVLIDQNHFRNAPATDFLNYTDFNVQNARENEDVYFKVCRQRVSNIQYSGDLGIYIIANADSDTEKRVKVYGRDLAGSITNECENKVILASDFKHEPGTYEMGFCVRFKVKYGYEKEICKTSNRYRIYPQPTDLNSRIRDLERQLDNAQPSSLAVPDESETAQNGNSGNQNGSGSTNGNSNNNGGQSGTGVQPPSCAINAGNIGIVCGGDGLLRL